MTNLNWLGILHLRVFIICRTAFFQYVPRYEDQSFNASPGLNAGDSRRLEGGIPPRPQNV